MPIKLNLGASPIWEKDGWHALDHKLKESEGFRIAGSAVEMDLPDSSCEVVFCSHVFEHIPHVLLPSVLSEINRVLMEGGVLRILTPDLEKVARAYVEKDKEFFREARDEDPSLRTDLGLGGLFMNFIVSPGQDTILIDRAVSNFIAGYAHLYSYDFDMLRIMLSELGFLDIERAKFCVSSVSELCEPLHVSTLPPVWENMNPDFYKKYSLTHELVNGKYKINFKVTGFDRDPLTSLIIECKKGNFVSKQKADEKFNFSESNYNRYAFSLTKDDEVTRKLKLAGISLNAK